MPENEVTVPDVLNRVNDVLTAVQDTQETVTKAAIEIRQTAGEARTDAAAARETAASALKTATEADTAAQNALEKAENAENSASGAATAAARAETAALEAQTMLRSATDAANNAASDAAQAGSAASAAEAAARETADAMQQLTEKTETALAQKADSAAMNDALALKADKTQLPGAASQTANGLMSAADKKKLDGIAAGAQVNSNQFAAIEFSLVSANAGHGGFIDFHFNRSTADYTSRIIEYASGELTINGTIFRNNGATRQGAAALSNSQTITVNSADCVNLATSGAVTLAFTPAAANISAVKVICLKASAATTLTIANAVWANNGSAPAWGNAGKILVLLAHFVGGRVVLSVADNTQ